MNGRLRALATAQDEYERSRADGWTLVDEGKRAEILALAADFPRLWRDPNTPHRERKRMVRLLIDDVTLLRSNEITAHVRFRGGPTHTFHLPLPVPAPLLHKVDAAIVTEIDHLLDEHTEAEVATILNQRGLVPPIAAVFTPVVISHIRRTHHLRTRFTRLREAGPLTLDEIAAALGVHPATVKRQHQTRPGRLVSHAYNDKGQRLYAPPHATTPATCQWCRGTIVATGMRSGPPRKWCRPVCSYAAYRDRRRIAAAAPRSSASAKMGPFDHDSASDPADEVQSVA